MLGGKSVRLQPEWTCKEGMMSYDCFYKPSFQVARHNEVGATSSQTERAGGQGHVQGDLARPHRATWVTLGLVSFVHMLFRLISGLNLLTGLLKFVGLIYKSWQLLSC
jgi:hypothetical protein